MAALQLKKKEASDDSRCPSCGAALPEGAVLCVQCGYDLRTGRRVDAEAAPKRSPLAIAGVALLVAVAAGIVAWRIAGSQSSAPAPVPPPAPVAAPAPAPQPAPAVEPTPAPVLAEAVPAVTNGSPAAGTGAVAQVAAEPPAPPPEPVLDTVALQAEQRAAAEAQYDQKAPLYGAGDEVELRLNNGMVQRGIFKSRNAESLVVQVDSNLTKTIEFATLDRGSRVRSDPDYRARYIDFQVQQRVQKILQQQGAGPAETTPAP